MPCVQREESNRVACSNVSFPKRQKTKKKGKTEVKQDQEMGVDDRSKDSEINAYGQMQACVSMSSPGLTLHWHPGGEGACNF